MYYKSICKIMDLKKLEDTSTKELEEFSKKYPEDIGRLYDSYKTLQTQTWSKDFLNGYLSAISDLIIIKKEYWGTDADALRRNRHQRTEAYQEIGISPEEKVEWLLTFHGGNKAFAKSHAEDCLQHCKTDNEPVVVEEFWKNVLILFENEKA
jgi:hypothetical protein